MEVKTSKNSLGLEDDKRFMLNQLEHSEKMKRDERHIDQMVLQNYIMGESETGPTLKGAGRKRIRFRHPETHSMIETLNAKLTLSMVGEDGFISADRVGPEDVFGAEVVRLLTESTFRKPGNFRAMYCGNKNALLFGSEVYFPFWSYQEVNAPLRLEGIDPETGRREVSEYQGTRVIANHAELMPLGDDFFPEPGKDEVRKMLFCSRRFTIPAFQARQMAKEIDAATGKPRWDPRAVERAIDRISSKDEKRSSYREERGSYSGSSPFRNPKSARHEEVNPRTYSPHSDYEILVGYEGYGLTPHMNRDGARRRRITLLNEEIVESIPMPINSSRITPFYDIHLNPIQGKFYGVSPGKVARYTQDFMNALLLCISEVVVRTARPPLLVQKNSGINMDRLRDWKGPITARDINAVKELRYNPNLNDAFNLMAGTQQQIREATGALGQISGAGFGGNQLRSASEAIFLGQQALDRPEMMASLFEYEYLPQIGQAILDLHQQFIEDTDDLARRIGRESLIVRHQGQRVEAKVDFDQIQGEFDIKFIGSRRAGNKQVRLQAIERAFQAIAAAPGVAPLFPWEEAIVEYLSLLDMRKIEAMVANPAQIDAFISRAQQQIGGPNSSANGNGAGVSLPPPIGPAQFGGAALA